MDTPLLKCDWALVTGAGLQDADLSRPGEDKIALRRFGTPAEVAAVAVAVLSERFGAYVTGATIAVDGGMTLHDGGMTLHNWIDP